VLQVPIFGSGIAGSVSLFQFANLDQPRIDTIMFGGLGLASARGRKGSEGAFASREYQ